LRSHAKKTVTELRRKLLAQPKYGLVHLSKICVGSSVVDASRSYTVEKLGRMTQWGGRVKDQGSDPVRGRFGPSRNTALVAAILR
jgi:hypothetical protein